MIHVEIENFQSIKELSFSIDGFTTLIGRNFLGKSATLRAINAALTNQQGTDFIRWGEKFCEVRLVIGDLSIIWHKEKGNNFYKINDEIFTKVGAQAPPKPILDAGFSLIDLGNEKVNLFYAEQFHPMFLVDRNDSKSADLLISLYKLDRLYKAVELCGKDRRTSRDLLKIRRGDRDLAEQALDRFKTLEGTLTKLNALKDKKLVIESVEGEVTHLKDLMKKIIECTLAVKRLRPVRELEISDINSTEGEIKEVRTLRDKLERLQDLKNSIVKLRTAKDVILPEEAAESIQTKIKETKGLRTHLLRYEDLTRSVERLKKASTIEVPTVSVDIEKLKKLKEMQAGLLSAAFTVKKIKSEIADVEATLGEVTEELTKYEICPACGSKLEKA